MGFLFRRNVSKSREREREQREWRLAYLMQYTFGQLIIVLSERVASPQHLPRLYIPPTLSDHVLHAFFYRKFKTNFVSSLVNSKVYVQKSLQKKKKYVTREWGETSDLCINKNSFRLFLWIHIARQIMCNLLYT